jgi:hypothetical protein
MTLCHACGLDLRDAPIHDSVDGSAPDGREIAFQEKLLRATREGWIKVSGQEPVYSHLYFTVLRQLMRIMATGRKAPALRSAAVKEFGLRPFAPRFSGGCRGVERLDVTARRGLLAIAWHLLEEWPHGLVEFCRANRVWSSTLLGDLDAVPFWYWRVINEHLYRISYCPSDEEIDSAAGYLRGRGTRLTKNSLSQSLGVTDVRRKRRSWNPAWED